MVLLWILGVLAALIILLCMTRVGVHAVIRDGEALIRARAGIVRFRVYPTKKKKSQTNKPEKEKKQNDFAFI